jgi:hypothetical protein
MFSMLLPIWTGVQNKPGFHLMPFSLNIKRGLVHQVLDDSTRVAITERYGSSDYHFITTPPGLSTWGSRLGDFYFEKLISTIKDLTGKTILEIGAGTLYIAKRVLDELHASSYIACDPALRADNNDARIEICNDYFHYNRFQNYNIDAVLLINLLEHIVEPETFLSEIRQLIELGNGFIYVVVPDCERGMKVGDIGICLHEHISYFTRSSLQLTMEAAGLEIDWLLQHEDTLFAMAHANLHMSRSNTLPEIDILDTFQLHVEENLKFAEKVLKEAGETGQQWALHGCSVGLNNILALLNLTSSPHLYLFDGDEAKVGKYLPAFDRPIMHANDPFYKSMMGAIIAAPTYFEQIREYVIETHNLPQRSIRSLLPIV